MAATARLFVRLSAASVCFFHSFKRHGNGASVHSFVRRVCLFFIISCAATTARLFIRLSVASVCFFHLFKRHGDGASVHSFVRRVCLFFIILSATQCRVCGSAALQTCMFVFCLFTHNGVQRLFVRLFMHAHSIEFFWGVGKVSVILTPR
jgi:hypothetical protein